MGALVGSGRLGLCGHLIGPTSQLPQPQVCPYVYAGLITAIALRLRLC